METSPGLATTAAALAHPTRAEFCMALLDGRAWTARELAEHVGAARSSTSEHLDVLEEAGLVTTERQGRHRYVRLADAEVAELVETLASRSPAAGRPVGLRAVARDRALARARTCYDHLAGTLGVGTTDALVHRSWLDAENGLALTAAGRDGLHALGVGLPSSRRTLSRPCLDWTERRAHVAGAVGAALCGHALEHGWVRRRAAGRALDVTAAGDEAFAALGVATLHPSPAAP